VSDKLQECLIKFSLTRSVGMSLARRFNAGIIWLAGSRRVATTEFALLSGVATRR